MNISKTDWHYKVLRTTDQYKVNYRVHHRSLSLCNYFWFVVFGVMSWFWTGVGILCFYGLALFLGGLVLYFWVYLIDFQILGSMLDRPYEVNLIIISLFCNFVLFFGLSSDFIVKKYKSFWSRKTTKPKRKPSLIIEYIKAKKAKVCPVMVLGD